MFKQLVLGAALVCATGSAALAGNGSNLTKFVPDTTQAMIVMDVSTAKNSKLLKESFQKMLDSKPDAQAKMAEMGIDPMKDIDTVAFAMGGAEELSKMNEGAMLIIVEGRLPKDKLAKMNNATKTLYKGVEVWSKDDSEGAIVDGRLFFTKKGQLNAAIDLVKGGKNNLAASTNGKAMRDALKNASMKSHLWMTVLIPKKDRDMMSSASIAAESFSMSFDFADDVKAGIRIATATAANAESSLKMLNTVLPQLKQAMGSVGLTAAASTVTLAQDKASINASIRITSGEIKQLVTMASGMAGAAAAPPTKTPPPAPAAKPTGGLGKTPAPAPAH